MISSALHLAEARGVPELVAEVAALFDLALVEQHVLPVGALRITPKRSASAPYLAMRSSGSGELPSDFDILRPCLSRMMPVK